MSWDFCFKLLDGGMFAIDLSNHRVNSDTIHDFAEWLEWELQRRRQAHNGGLWVTRGHVLAYAVDLSRNNLDDSSLEVLLKVLATARVAVGIQASPKQVELLRCRPSGVLDPIRGNAALRTASHTKLHRDRRCSRDHPGSSGEQGLSV